MTPGPATGAEGDAVDHDALDRAIQAELDRQAARDAAGEGEPPLPDTPMYLSHHWPDQYDRCATIGGLHVCRRCLVLYPVALVTGVLVGIGSWWPHDLDAVVLWLFPLAGVVEFVLDNLGRIRYSPRRQVLLSAAGAVAAGVGYVRYLDDGTDPLVWTVVGVYTAVCVAAVVVGALTRRSQGTGRARRTGTDGPTGPAGPTASGPTGEARP